MKGNIFFNKERLDKKKKLVFGENSGRNVCCEQKDKCMHGFSSDIRDLTFRKFSARTRERERERDEQYLYVVVTRGKTI